MRSEPILVARDITKSYGRRRILDVPEFSVERGKIFALLGSSGAGKSTLLRIIGLLERPDTGRVYLDGREVTQRDRSGRMRIAMLFQKPYLFTGSVGDNVAYGLKTRGVGGDERRERVATALELVGLGGFEERDHRALSGGESQRVALARALVLEPDVLLLDEPLSFIDPLAKERLTRQFSEVLREQNVTAVWVTHDQEEAFGVADDVGILREGRFEARGPLDHVMSLPETPWVASFIGMEPPLRGHVVEAQEGLVEVAFGETRLFGMGESPVGTEVLVAVRPEDVVLFRLPGDLPLSSARNRIEGIVTDVVAKGAMVRVVVAAGPNATIASLVSRASTSELGLEPGRRVLALFKATATRIVTANDGRPDR